PLTPLLTSFSLFSSSCLHLPLPSFPTRRSSDLFDKRQHGRQLLRRPEHRLGIEGQRGISREISTPNAFGSWQAHCDQDERSPRTDRKSTRLNSSHVSISYAVFCLKKKTNIHISQ